MPTAEYTRWFYSLPGAVFGYSAQYGTKFHAGKDYEAAGGSVIPCPGSGRVVLVGYRTDAGHYITVIIGSQYFLFYHLREKPSLVPGDQVSFGSALGIVGSTGLSTGNHVHVAVSNNPYPAQGTRVDPAPIIASMVATASAASSNITPYEKDEDMARILKTTETDNGKTSNGKVFFDGPGGVKHIANPVHLAFLQRYLADNTSFFYPAEWAIINSYLTPPAATIDAKPLTDAVAAAVKLALTNANVTVDPAAIASATAAAVDTVLADDFAKVNANIDDQPTTFTIAPAKA